MERTTSMSESEFLAAYDRYADAIFRFCLVRTGNREAAKDILQETFTRAWEHNANSKPITNTRAFLYRIAANLIIDRVRAHQPLSLDVLLEDEHFVPPASSQGSPQDAAMIGEIARTINRLDEKYRTPLVLRYMEGMGVDEIARIIDESPNVVSVHLHRGIKKLQEQLGVDE